MQNISQEVIFAMLLVDLPIDVENKDGVKVRDNFGESWWFLTCECDDHYVDIVKEVVSICTFQQVRELCSMNGGSRNNGDTVMMRATPQSRRALTQALRFVGRFEFIGNSALHADPSIGLKEFDALDFGGQLAYQDFEEGRRVLLKCYALEEPFMNEVSKCNSLWSRFELLYFYSHHFILLF